MSDDFYVRYYIGHKGKFGHEFIEFEFNGNGEFKYQNGSHYCRKDTVIRKKAYVSNIVLDEIKRFIDESHILEKDDSLWPEANVIGKQELEINYGSHHISFETCKISTLLEVNDCKDPEGLKTLYYLAQDLKTLVFDLISLHFKIKPYNV